MRMRRALVSLALGSALALGGTAATAHAATPEPSWHLVALGFSTEEQCLAYGEAKGIEVMMCDFIGVDMYMGWTLYAWY
jgi:hypothetical protein